jgi:magnesium transporter
MNFENMPELRTRNGYYLTLAVMAVVTVGLLIFFWRKGWIFEDDEIEFETEKTEKHDAAM